ncbi:MMS19 nucleotide excision repair protein homolog isoform X2 [Clupea harengus]|uniref:MMS19 nucleotide excision repair protein n=1 Tax=Clupea harengus TaxID=7950 RepID=A0A6P8FM99_CLUHA|nr:MMS19 nucleotide excision repair protein homolog isoform X2 [Clupea harengus]
MLRWLKVNARSSRMATDSTLLLGLVEEFVSGQQDTKATETAKGVKTGQFTVLQLVEALGLSLTSSQQETRARGVKLLSQVLQECYSYLNEREVEVLVAFYENRLKDHYVIIPPVLQGLKALTKSSALPPGSAVSILKSVFQDTHVQSLMIQERSCVYNILMNLMESREQELKGLGSDFVFGFVQSMDGERDPRNLLLSFQIAGNIIAHGYEMGKFTEELFEVTSCYFPIDFTPPPNDPHGITQEDLILSLRAVLTGTPLFAEFLMPLIIEKLDSDVQSAKVDSLQTLAACGPVYGHKELAQFLSGLWSSLRREVFQTASERVETAALSALSALTACLSRSVISSDSDDSLHTLLDLVLKDCQHHLLEPDLKLVWPSAKILQAVGGASYRACLRVGSAVVPLLLEQYINRTQSAQRRTLLEVLQGFIQPTEASRPAEGEENVLLPFQSSLCGVVFSALSESGAGLQTTATRILTALGQQSGVLTPPDVDLAVDHLTTLILQEDDPQVSGAVVECCGSLAPLHPSAFTSRMVPKLKEHIFTEPMVQGNGPSPDELGSQNAVRQRCVTALARVACEPSLVQESTPVLLQVLTAAHTGGGSFSVDEVISVCHSLQRIAEHAPHMEAEIGQFFHDVIIPRLLGLALQAAVQDEGPCGRSPLVEEAVLSAVAPVISSCCSRLNADCAKLSASRAVSLFLNGDVAFLPNNNLPTNTQLLKTPSPQVSQLVCLLTASVCSLPRSVEIPEIDRLLKDLEEVSCTHTHSFTHTFAAKCYAGLINKRPNGPALDAVLERSMKRVSVELDNSASCLRTQALTLLLWVTKALLLRYHPLSTTLTDKLFSLLSDRALGPLVADGFSLLMSDSSDVLNRSCHADVRIMYRQRFFSENSAKLVQGFNSAPPEEKAGYLKALSHIMNNLPREVQMTELPALLPLFLEALGCCNECVCVCSQLLPLFLEALSCPDVGVL